MKKSLVFLAAVAVLGLSAAVQAETYDGVQVSMSTKTRAEVSAAAVGVAHAPDQNIELGSRGPLPFTAVADRATVRSEAVAAAHAPNQNIKAGSRVNSLAAPHQGPAAHASHAAL